MDGTTVLLLVGAGFAAGVVNALAGGGTFFTFPAMLAAGLPPVTAVASSAVAVWPGHAAAVPMAWRTLARTGRRLGVRSLVALTGGVLGACLLLAAGDRALETAVPWLILLATALFAFGPRLRGMAARFGRAGAFAGLALEFLAAVYGGYFGAGLGILLMACLTLLGHDDPREANALKNLLASLVGSVGVLVFVLADAVAWPPTLIALAGAAAGGVAGARAVERVPAAWLRRAVIAVGVALTVIFFRRAYG